MASEQWPTADEVALAIVAASRETAGAEFATTALAVGGRERLRSNYGRLPQLAVARARSYAALALDDIFACGAPACARMVGAGSINSYLATLHYRIAHGTAPWFSPAALVRVIAAVRGGLQAEPASPPERFCAAVAALPPAAQPLRSRRLAGELGRLARLVRERVPADVRALTLRCSIAPNSLNVTAGVLGDPAPERSALAKAGRPEER